MSGQPCAHGDGQCSVCCDGDPGRSRESPLPPARTSSRRSASSPRRVRVNRVVSTRLPDKAFRRHGRPQRNDVALGKRRLAPFLSAEDLDDSRRTIDADAVTAADGGGCPSGCWLRRECRVPGQRWRRGPWRSPTSVTTAEATRNRAAQPGSVVLHTSTSPAFEVGCRRIVHHGVPRPRRFRGSHRAR